MSIKLTFLGGASSIGASCAILEVDETSLLIDCGIRFKGEQLPNLEALSGKNLTAVLVTHAHTDHTGALPLIAQSFPTSPIYGTGATLALIEVLQKDALNIMKNSIEAEGDIPIYSKEDVERMQMLCRPVNFNATVTVGCCQIRFLPAGHILGAAMIHVDTPYGTILFTGDYSLSSQHTLPRLLLPDVPVDMIITESTYGGRLHQDRKLAEQKFISQIADVLSQNGRVLIPCFAIGRAQEVLMILHGALQSKQLPPVPCYIDGMVRSVVRTYRDFTKLLSKKGKFIFENGICRHGIQIIQSVVERQTAIQKPGPSIFVASSGMLTGGPSAFFASHLLSNENDAILITGYQDEESPGRGLLDLAQGKAKDLELWGKTSEVKCKVSSYSLSAHADEGEVISLIRTLGPKQVVLVHGDPAAQRSIAQRLSNDKVLLAREGETYTFRFSSKPSQQKNVKQSQEIESEDIQKVRAMNPFASLEMTCKFLGLLKPVETKVAQSKGFSCSLSLYFMETDLTTTEHFHESYDAAKGLCAIEMLDSIAAKLHMNENIKTDTDIGENFKGKMGEACIKEGVARYLVIAMPGPRFRCIAEMNDFSSSIFEASSRKDAEQSAAKDLYFKYIEGRRNEETASAAIRPSQFQQNKGLLSLVRASDSRGKLNELCQHKVLVSVLYEDLRDFEQNRKKMFEVCARATLPDGTTVSGAPASASTKKEAQKEAAELLFSRLVRECSELNLQIPSRP